MLVRLTHKMRTNFDGMMASDRAQLWDNITTRKSQMDTKFLNSRKKELLDQQEVMLKAAMEPFASLRVKQHS
jgi:hypothetical protein